MSEKLLEVKNLKTSFFIESGEVEAVRGVTFRLNKGEVVGIVGESGSGKSVMAKSVMSLVTSPGKVKEGEIFFIMKTYFLNLKKNYVLLEEIKFHLSLKTQCQR